MSSTFGWSPPELPTLIPALSLVMKFLACFLVFFALIGSAMAYVHVSAVVSVAGLEMSSS